MDKPKIKTIDEVDPNSKSYQNFVETCARLLLKYAILGHQSSQEGKEEKTA